MEPISKKEEAFSEDLNDLLSKMPNWPVLWGTTLVFVILIVAFIFSYFIKYPEIIEGQVIVTTVEPPVKLSASQSKAIKKIYIQNHEMVEKDQVLLEFRSASSLEEIIYLQQMLDEVQKDLNSQSLKLDYNISRISIGERQSQLSELNNAITAYNRFLQLMEFEKKIALIDKRISFKENYAVILKNLLSSVKERTENERENFLIQKELYEEKVISKVQFLTEQVSFLSKEEQVNEFRKAIVQNEISIHEDIIEKENLRISDNFKKMQLYDDISRIINNLKSFKEEWFHVNTIRSPKAGEVNYLKNFYVDEHVNIGDPLLAINTDSPQSIAYCYLPIEGYGKVKTNQKARIKLNNFPYEEFGFLEGKVKSISQFPSQDLYLIVIELNNGSTTNTNKKLNLISETKGIAEIVTRDLRLIERIFNNLIKLSLKK